MPEFVKDGKLYYNPVEFALDQIGGTWKMPLLWRLKNRTMRYNELKKSLNKITHKMLTTSLRDLEKDGFISREVFPEVPPKVEYSLTKKGERAIEIINIIRNYGLELMEAEGINH